MIIPHDDVEVIVLLAMSIRHGLIDFRNKNFISVPYPGNVVAVSQEFLFGRLRFLDLLKGYFLGLTTLFVFQTGGLIPRVEVYLHASRKRQLHLFLFLLLWNRFVFSFSRRGGRVLVLWTLPSSSGLLAFLGLFLSLLRRVRARFVTSWRFIFFLLFGILLSDLTPSLLHDKCRSGKKVSMTTFRNTILKHKFGIVACGSDFEIQVNLSIVAKEFPVLKDCSFHLVDEMSVKLIVDIRSLRPPYVLLG
jgi:hypothetical protein